MTVAESSVHVMNWTIFLINYHNQLWHSNKWQTTNSKWCWTQWPVLQCFNPVFIYDSVITYPHCGCVCVLSLSGIVQNLRTTFTSCSQTACLQRSLIGWRPPSHRGFGSLWDAQMRSPSSAALCTQCRLGYLWRGKITHMFIWSVFQ